MELKFLLFTFLVLFAVFGSIETGRSSGRGSSRGSSSRGSSSRGSSSHSSSSRGSSSYGSSGHGSSSGWGSSSSNRGSSSSSRGTSSSSSGLGSSSWGSSSNRGSGSHGTSSHSTGSFLNHERNHGSSSGNSHTHSPTRPFGTVPPPKHTGSNTNSPFKPFGTVPPPKHTGSNTNSPFKPFGTVPPPKHTGSNTNSPLKPFGTVPPPRNTGTIKPPPGVVLPGTLGHNRQTPPPITHPGGHQLPPLSTRPGSHSGHNNRSTGGISPPSPGFNIPTSRPPTGSGITQTQYPTQGANPGNSGTNYPRQPPYNPSYPGNHHSSNFGHNNKSVGGISPPGPGFVIPGPNTRPPTGGFPTGPVQQTRYPTQGTNPGGFVPGPNYPRQPPYNPAYPNIPPPVYSPYPGHQPNYNIQPGQPSHFYPQVTHSLPPNPSHTVVIVPGQSGGGYQSRTTGDIFKEALIHAGVNAAVHRITSPHHYYDRPSSGWNGYGTPPQGSNSVTSTNTHIVNNNYYGEVPGGTGNTGNTGSGVNLPPNNNGQFNSGGGIQGGLPSSVNTPGNTGNFGNPGNSVSSGSAGTVGSQIPSNGQSSPSHNNGNGQGNNEYPITWDQDLMNISEKLFSLDENNATKFISLNLQKQIEANNSNITDLASQPLFSVQPEAYNIPTVRAIRSLYEVAFEIKNKTRLGNSRKEEALFVDLILNTNVMIAAMDFLAQKNLIQNDYYEHKDMLKHLWFTPYDGISSGFKRIFQGEVWEGILWGIQDWIAFDFHEKAGRANYLSYVQKTDLGKTSPPASILKTNFEMSGTQKTGTALFVGTSPELQMALYTICFYTRPNNYCDISLGGTKLKIYTHMDRYFGKDLINVAFPIV